MAVDIKLNNSDCRIDFKSINFSTKETSLEQSLKNISPFDWSNDILNGQKKVSVYAPGTQNVQER